MGKKAGKAKKRNKKYTGVNAKKPTNIVRVHRVDAVVRSDFMQWMVDHQRILKGAGIAILVIALIIAGLIALF